LLLVVVEVAVHDLVVEVEVVDSKKEHHLGLMLRKVLRIRSQWVLVVLGA
jgi:uncharacterized membrane protein (UPF0127 family)